MRMRNVRFLFLYLLSSTVIFATLPLFAQEVAPRPTIGMTLRGVTQGIVEQGEPMRVDVQMQVGRQGVGRRNRGARPGVRDLGRCRER